MSYYRFKDYNGNDYGSFETVRVTRSDRADWGRDEDGCLFRCGWYWRACFPGCLPDSDPIGPFRSEAAAIRDARESSQ